jgi:FtsZ-binding cell division protein ZapB
MVTIEQVELLESKVSKAIEYVKRLTAENEQLRGVSNRVASENSMLHGKLDGYQKRIAELEEILLGFKKDQERIEQGIISALDRLNHFEDAIDTVSSNDAASSGTAEGVGLVSTANNVMLGLDAASHGGTADDAGGAAVNNAELDVDAASYSSTVDDDEDNGDAAFRDGTADEGRDVQSLSHVTQSTDTVPSFPLGQEISADDGCDETADRIPMTAYDGDITGDPVNSNKTENFDEAVEDEMDILGEDEFLEVLKSDRGSEPVTAFSEEALPGDTSGKTADGPELDIF